MGAQTPITVLDAKSKATGSSSGGLPEAQARRLQDAVRGRVLTDPFARGRYATDASAYQVIPLAVVEPEDAGDVAAVIELAREEGIPVLPRGGGTSQCGQTVNRAIVLDCSRRMNRLLSFDAEARRATVQPGLVLDELNRALKPRGLWYPVDVSTASRATIGGMAGNNSCGTRSIRYGTMRDNVAAIRAILPDGTARRFSEIRTNEPESADPLARDLLALGAANAEEIRKRFPNVTRRVGGYNVDALLPQAQGGNAPNNLSHLLIGSEGTLAFSTEVELKLSPVLGTKALGVCHFAKFRDAMEAAQHLVKLGPVAVELVDSTMVELARGIPMYLPTVAAFVRGEPEALLLVEFAEDDAGENERRLKRLSELMGDLGHSWGGQGRRWGGVVEVTDSRLQLSIAEVRASGLNIMMSMKDERKPVSFVEDCAVPLEHLADYTDRLTEVFERHGTRGTWYAHASVGCLHVRPVLNLKLDQDVRAMRAIAEEAFALVREYKGSHSGEHGDGIVRSEFHAPMFGARMVGLFEQVKDRFDPQGLFNPNRVVRPPKMDDRSLFRFPPGYKVEDRTTAFDWSAWPGAAGGFQGAVEMCNNNGACRKLAGGVMCPSFRVTRDERDSTRGRANTLRLAISGQLGPNALASDAMMDTLKLCVGCKACKRECPASVDMAKMKTEALAARIAERGLSARDRLIAYLPRYAPYAGRAAWAMNLQGSLPGGKALTERLLGLSAKRSLPGWASHPFRAASEAAAGAKDAPPVVLFADTFNAWQEPENLRAAVAVLEAGGYRVIPALPKSGKRPLCCGRTFLATGLVEEARLEARRVVEALLPYAQAGVPIVGLEPSCLLTLRDEFKALLPGEETDALASNALLFEEFLAREAREGRLDLPLERVERKAYLHGHCHQKAFAAFTPVAEVLKLVPGLEVETIESGCCGMAGAFGYQAETYEVSMRMAELSLLPAVRAAPPEALVVADGTSCRHQIVDGAGRAALHAARVLAMALPDQQAAGG